jgi:predicted regulator of amino acid metabolism with ACT domain
MARPSRRRTAKRRDVISFRVSPKVRNAIDTVRKQGRKVVILGVVKGGKIEMSPQGLAAATSFQRRQPRATIAFIALNAPFKTKAVTAVG